MNRIAQAFETLKKQGKSAVIPYITPEFPVKGTTVPLILALESAGAALIEIGIPFSDPLADGPTIQHSSDVSIKNGVNIPVLLQMIKEARMRTALPLILMGYINPMLQYGLKRLVNDARVAGADGFIIPDLPPEESGAFRDLCTQNGLSNIFLIAPTSPDERIRYIDQLSTDFTYCVSVTGVTGARNSFAGGLEEFLDRVKRNTKKPFVVGFGIKDKTQVQNISRHAQGVVVGSALIQAMQGESTVDAAVAKGKEFLLSLQ